MVLIYGVFFMSMPISQARMEDRQHRDIFLLAIGVLVSLAGRTGFARSIHAGEERLVAACAFALPGYALFQIVPLPLAMVAALSPVRAELVRALTPVTGPHWFASLSIVPAATFTHFLLLSSYCAIFFAAWEFADRARENVWALAAPVVLAAAVETLLGFMQLFKGVDSAALRGTYPIRNHLSGLLEMALPFPAMYTFSVPRQASPGGIGAAGMLREGAGAALTVLLATGIMFTLSRGGLVAAMSSVLVMAAVATNWNMPLRRKIGAACLFFALAAGAVYYLTPLTMVSRLEDHNTAGRLSVWREGIGILAQYPLVGCGLGGFESAFLRFKTVEGLFVVDYAHNDYLQLFAELGTIGFLLVAALLSAVSRHVASMTKETSGIRWAALACLGSLTAIVVHSAFDFNLYVAGNAAVLAWIGGIATGLKPEPFPVVGTIEMESIREQESVSPRRSMPSL